MNQLAQQLGQFAASTDSAKKLHAVAIRKLNTISPDIKLDFERALKLKKHLDREELENSFIFVDAETSETMNSIGGVKISPQEFSAFMFTSNILTLTQTNIFSNSWLRFALDHISKGGGNTISSAQSVWFSSVFSLPQDMDELLDDPDSILPSITNPPPAAPAADAEQPPQPNPDGADQPVVLDTPVSDDIPVDEVYKTKVSLVISTKLRAQLKLTSTIARMTSMNAHRPGPYDPPQNPKVPKKQPKGGEKGSFADKGKGRILTCPEWMAGTCQHSDNPSACPNSHTPWRIGQLRAANIANSLNLSEERLQELLKTAQPLQPNKKW